MVGEGKSKAVIVGGGIARISGAQALKLAGWDVVVLEKTTAPPTASSTGAGLRLDPLSLRILHSWLPHPELLRKTTEPPNIGQKKAIHGEKQVSWILTREEYFNFRAAHWTDLHRLLYNSLPPNVFLWGHLFHSFNIAAEILKTGKIAEIVADLLVAADGCFSSIRRKSLYKLRYSGYCAWIGVLDYSETEDSEIVMGIKKAYPGLGYLGDHERIK